MSRPRTCPHCHEPATPTGVSFDGNLNVVCHRCKNIIFPACHDAETKVNAVVKSRQIPPPTTAFYPSYQNLHVRTPVNGIAPPVERE